MRGNGLECIDIVAVLIVQRDTPGDIMKSNLLQWWDAIESDDVGEVACHQVHVTWSDWWKVLRAAWREGRCGATVSRVSMLPPFWLSSEEVNPG